MNDNTVNTRLFPQRAIIVYHGNGQYNKDYYLESRRIQRKGKGFSLMTPTPVSRRIMQDIAGSFIKANAVKMDFDDLIPEHVIYGLNKTGLTSVVWYRPATTRSLNFCASMEIKKAIDVHIPAMLYVVVNKKLYIYALMTNARPTRTTKLYNAPFFNIYGDGNVCLGTAPVGRMKARTFEKEAERFERGFYLAEQSGGQDKQCKSPLKKLWTGLIKSGAAFPSKKELVLHPKFKTLGDLFDKLISNTKDHEA